MDSNGSSAVAAAVDLTGSSAVAESQRGPPPTDRVFAEKRIAWEELNEEGHTVPVSTDTQVIVAGSVLPVKEPTRLRN